MVASSKEINSWLHYIEHSFQGHFAFGVICTNIVWSLHSSQMKAIQQYTVFSCYLLLSFSVVSLEF